jgi:hypothetical protein
MNRNSFYSVAFLALCLSGSAVAYSQVINNEIASVGSSHKFKTGSPISTEVAAPNEKSVLIFNKMFGNATNVLWSTEGKGLPIAYFDLPGKKNRAGFDKKGNLVYTISYYKEEQLPKPVLLKVKETYFGKNIYCVTEVNYDGKTAYLIILEDKTSWLHIKIVGDEMVEERVMIKG